MIGFEIQGLNDLQQQLDEAQEAFAELDGEIATISFNAADPASVDAAILDMQRAIDAKMARFDGNEMVESAVGEVKANFRDQILAQAAEARSAEEMKVADKHVDQATLRQIENTITDLRRAEYKSFGRHIKKLSRLLHSEDLDSISSELTTGVDLDQWIEAGDKTQGGMIGSAELEWPPDPKQEIGMGHPADRQLRRKSRQGRRLFPHVLLQR